MWQIFQSFPKAIFLKILLLILCVGALTHGSVAVAAATYVGDYVYTNERNGGFKTEAEAVANLAVWNTNGTIWCRIEAWPAQDWQNTAHSLYWKEGLSTQMTRNYNYNVYPCGVATTPTFGTTQLLAYRTVCTWTQRYDSVAKECQDGSYLTLFGSGGGNFGPSWPCCGKPINPMTANMWHVMEDFASVGAGGLALRRTYNSVLTYPDPTDIHGFGVRWTTPYDAVLRHQQSNFPAFAKQCWQRSDGMLFCDTPPQPTIPRSAIPAAVSISRGDGNRYLFNKVGSEWVSDAHVNDRVTAVFNSDNTAVIDWIYFDAKADATERFDADGKLLSIVSRNGRSQTMTYSDGQSNDTGAGRYPLTAPACSGVHPGSVLPIGRLLCVTDNWQRQLNFQYDDKGRIVRAVLPNGESNTYEYDGPSGGCVPGNEAKLSCVANNLTKVTYPDGKYQTFFYNEAARINDGANCSPVPSMGNGFGPYPSALTGLVDENGARYLTWNYYCGGHAKSSEAAGGAEKVTLGYIFPSYPTATRTSTVTHTVGTAAAPQATSRTYDTSFVNGVGKNTNIDQPCIECGRIKARTFDANGNVASTTDFNNAVTKYSFDQSRNLEISRIEAFGTAIARTITTVWHATLRLPIQVAEPLRITDHEYDLAGNLLVKTVQATTDVNGTSGVSAIRTGTARVWRYTYNALGQMLTATGPRRDMPDVTTYTYDGQGNISSVTNAAGHQTVLSNYDANGHVGRITDPNGLVTTLTYNSRGWLASRTVGNETTTYTYDGVGQLTRVTQPDGAAVNYTYSDAHHLTGITDDAGNSIVYALDLLGNRIGEQVLDVNGVLARKVTRIYDTLGRLKTITGAQQ